MPVRIPKAKQVFYSEPGVKRMNDTTIRQARQASFLRRGKTPATVEQLKALIRGELEDTEFIATFQLTEDGFTCRLFRGERPVSSVPLDGALIGADLSYTAKVLRQRLRQAIHLAKQEPAYEP